MTFFSRCEAPPAVGRTTWRKTRKGRPARQRLLSDFVEEIGILFRYAAGLDYYGRNRLLPKD